MMKDELSYLQSRALEDFRTIRRNSSFAVAVEGDRSEDSLEAALFFAQSLGYCRLWGVELADLDGSLPTQIVACTMQHLATRINELSVSLEQYERDMELATTIEETELYSGGVLRQRMDAWAAWIAIDERIVMLLNDISPAKGDNEQEIGQALPSLMNAIEQWDLDLRARADLLCGATDTYLIENWRDALAVDYSLNLPWWLDSKFWDSVADAPLANYLPICAHETPSTAIDRQVTLELMAMRTGFQLGEALFMGASDVTSVPLSYMFRSQVEEQQAAFATVQVPRRYSADGTVEIDIRFRYVSRDALAVQVGSLISLGRNCSAVVIVDFPSEGQPLWKTRIRVSRQQLLSLKLDSHMRLQVGDKIWIPMGQDISP